MEMPVFTPATAVRIPTACFARSRRLLSPASNFSVLCNKNTLRKNGIRASVKQAKPQLCHSFNDISDCEKSDDAIVSPVETCMTIIENNSKALVKFSGLLDDETHDSLTNNYLYPYLPYVIGEHGNIYFHVEKTRIGILESFASEDCIIQVIIGMDTTKLVKKLDSKADSGLNVKYRSINDDPDSYENNRSRFWKKFCSSHPMEFDKLLANFVSDVPTDYVDKPSSRVFIQGLLRPAFVEDNSKEESEMRIYYKLNMINIHLISPHGNLTVVKVEDLIAHAAGKMKSDGDKMTRTFKSVCWRCKGIEREEVSRIGPDVPPFRLLMCN